MTAHSWILAVCLLAGCPADPPPPVAATATPAVAKASGGEAAAVKPLAQQKNPSRHLAPGVVMLAEDEPATFRTTSSKIFWLNLRGEIKELERLLIKTPKNVTMWRKLGSAQHRLGFLTGRIEPFADSLKSLDTAVELDGGSFDNRLVRARSRQSLHDFDGALEDVRFVLDKRADHRGAKELQDAIHWALGKYDDGKVRLQTAAFSAKTTAQAAAGQHLFVTGQVEAARKAYAAAMGGFKGVNPATVAWLEVQRGVTYLDSGAYPQAERLFLAATKRLGEFTMAEEHLAEVYALQGKHAEAVKLFGAVVERSGDPVFMAALADSLDAAGQAPQAKAERDRARAAFDARLKTFPQAVWQEAAEFHLAQGELPRALELATKNIGLRKDAASLALLARVQARSGAKDAALKSLSEALESPIRTAALFEAAHEVFAAVGKAEDAAKWLAEAKALNPKAG